MPKTIRRTKGLRADETATSRAPDPTVKPIDGKGIGWQETTLGEMLSLPDWDMRIIDLRLGLIRAIRQIRKNAGLTQVELAKRLAVSQPRMAMLESVEKEPTLNSLLPAFFAAGGTSAQLCEIVKRTDDSMSR